MAESAAEKVAQTWERKVAMLDSLVALPVVRRVRAAVPVASSNLQTYSISSCDAADVPKPL